MGLFSLFAKENYVYIPDSTTFLKNKPYYELYLKIFSVLGIPVKILEQQLFSGREALEAGYEATSRNIARKNFEFLKNQNIKKIITTSPECYKFLKQDYPQLIPDWDITVENIWEIILKKLEKNPGLIRYKAEEIITYHDNCYLGRYCKIYEEPRKILRLLGYSIQEMDNHRENSFCCGSCGGLPFVDKVLANALARERLLQAKRINVKKLIVIGFDNYNLLKENNTGIEVIELSTVLGKALGIEIPLVEVEETNNNKIPEELVEM